LVFDLIGQLHVSRDVVGRLSRNVVDYWFKPFTALLVGTGYASVSLGSEAELIFTPFPFFITKAVRKNQSPVSSINGM